MVTRRKREFPLQSIVQEELGRASRPPLDDQKFANVLESLRGALTDRFKASYRVWDGQLFWRGDDGSHRFAALYQYCIEHYVAHYDAFRLIVREIDADRIAAIQKDWCLFLAPPEIVCAKLIEQRLGCFSERRRNLDVSRFFVLTVPLEFAAISAPIDLLVVRADFPGAAILSADSRLDALNPLLDQIVPEADKSNIQGLILTQ